MSLPGMGGFVPVARCLLHAAFEEACVGAAAQDTAQGEPGTAVVYLTARAPPKVTANC